MEDNSKWASRGQFLLDSGAKVEQVIRRYRTYFEGTAAPILPIATADILSSRASLPRLRRYCRRYATRRRRVRTVRAVTRPPPLLERSKPTLQRAEPKYRPLHPALAEGCSLRLSGIKPGDEFTSLRAGEELLWRALQQSLTCG